MPLRARKWDCAGCSFLPASNGTFWAVLCQSILEREEVLCWAPRGPAREGRRGPVGSLPRWGQVLLLSGRRQEIPASVGLEEM